jgi:hypothetical protein
LQLIRVTMLLTRRRTEIVLNLFFFCLLAAGMALISDDVRGHVFNMISGDSATELSVIAAPARQVMHVVSSTFGDAKAAHGAVVAFGVAAVVLFGLMIRT